MQSIKTFFIAAVCFLCAGLYALSCIAIPAPASVIVNGCANRIGFLHAGSNMGQNCASQPKTIVNQTVGPIPGTSGPNIAATAFSVTGGNLIAVFVHGAGSTTTITVADTALNTFTPVTSCTDATQGVTQWFYAKNVTGNASDVVTATYSVSTTQRRIWVLQIAGASITSPLDAGPACAVGSSATPTSASFTTTTALEMLLAGMWTGTTALVWTPGAGYTLGTSDTENRGRTEFQAVSSIQSGVTASAGAGTVVGWMANVMTIK